MDSPVPSESDAAGGSASPVTAAMDSSDSDASSAEEGTAVNPAPPAAAAAGVTDVLHSDAIGDTLFSQRGVLRTLMALNAAVPRYLGLETPAGGDGGCGGDDGGCGGDDGGDTATDAADSGLTAEGGGGMEAESAGDNAESDGGVATSGSAVRTDAVAGESAAEPEQALLELDAELEEQLCRLWDMTAEKDVAVFVADSGLLDVAWPLLDRSPCPRLLEILAGTLANCAGHGAAALPGGAAAAAAAVGQLMANSRGDAPVLRETLRLAQAAVRAQPEPEPLLRALSGWLPLLAEVLRGALSAPLLRQTLGLLTAVAALPGSRSWWLAELAAAEEMPAAVLEALAQLVAGGGVGVTAGDALDCCRDALLLLAEVETLEDAVKPTSDAWLSPVPRLVRGVWEARRAAAATADPRLACCLLWLAAPALRRRWSDDLLATLLRFCDAARRSGDADDAAAEQEMTDGPATEQEMKNDPAVEQMTDEAATVEQERTDEMAKQKMTDDPAEQEMTEAAAEEEEAAEARGELAARLDATAAYVARHCGESAARFVWAPGRRREAALLLAALRRADPQLARRLELPRPAEAGDGTHQL